MEKINNTDIFGLCCQDYINGDKKAKITVRSDIAETDYITASYLFRSYNEMSATEQAALKQSKGKVLDVGAGAGPHSIYLQGIGYEVVSIDTSPLCCEIMKQRGLKNVVCTNIFEFKGEKFDTILLMSNGIGIAGTLANVPNFLIHLRSLLNPGGKIILESSDLQYLYLESDGSFNIPISDKYYGEICYNIEYKKNKSESFNWIFIDPYSLEAIAKEISLDSQIFAQGENYDYIAFIQ